MSAQDLHSSINLLPKSEFETSFWGRILKWALSAGRYIIILTELVVIIAFISRFKLDKDLADLSDSIAGKKAILEALGPTEKNFLSIQAKLERVDGLLKSQLTAKKYLDQIMSHLPPNLTLETLAMDKNGATITGRAADKQVLGEFLQKMAGDKTWKTLELSELVTNEQENSVLKFTLKSSF